MSVGVGVSVWEGVRVGVSVGEWVLEGVRKIIAVANKKGCPMSFHETAFSSSSGVVG